MAKDQLDRDTGEILNNDNDIEANFASQEDDDDIVEISHFIRSPYNYDRDQASLVGGLMCLDESLAQQHMAEDADINVIVKRFGITGQMPQNPRLPSYGDFTGVSDFRSALEAVRDAEDAFGELPGDLRARFDNDPQRYLDFVENPANQQQIYDLGLAERPRTPHPPTDAPQAPPAAPAADAG